MNLATASEIFCVSAELSGWLCPGSPFIRGITNACPVTKDQSVYIMCVEALGLYKVGVSNSPETRLTAVQTGQGHRVTLGGSSIIDRSGVCPLAMEKIMHSILRQHHMQGEWFRASPAIIGRAFKEAWVATAYPPLYRRWERYMLHLRSQHTMRARRAK